MGMEIYLITNTVNGKHYVGQTKTTAHKRFLSHLKDARRDDANCCPILKNAIQKHGAENFKVERIAIAQTQEELDRLEIELIQSHNCLFPDGYNICIGGNGRKSDGTWFLAGDRQCGWVRKKIEQPLARPEPEQPPEKDKYIGVCKARRGNKWRTRYDYHNYETRQDAALAFDLETFKRFGASAKFNYPENLARYAAGTVVVNSYRNRSKSLYRGITWHNGKWLAQICIQRKAKCLGYFATQEEAAQAYDKRARELFGDKAKLNFPQG
jgi:hypothetical protein